MIVAVDAGSGDDRDAEHLAHNVVEVLGPVPADLLVSTHPVRVGPPHAAVCLSWSGDADPGEWAGRVHEALPEGSLAAVVATGGSAAAPVTVGTTAALDGALVALALRRLGRNGRLVVYPGQRHLRGTLPVERVTEVSAIDEIVLIGGGRIAADAVLDTRDYVRPVWQDGRIVLQVEPWAGGLLRCFEEEHQRACCRDHR